MVKKLFSPFNILFKALQSFFLIVKEQLFKLF